MKRLIPILLAAVSGPALADYNMNGKVIDCYCTDSTGGRIEVGDSICLHVDGRMFMAQCQMSLNVPMWRQISNGCLSSRSLLPQSLKPGLDPRPVDAEVTPPKS
jgi:hypothetical protein